MLNSEAERIYDCLNKQMNCTIEEPMVDGREVTDESDTAHTDRQLNYCEALILE